jgi:hypothetical protein
MGFLQSSLPAPGFLKFAVYLPHRPGSLHEFLDNTTYCEVERYRP